MSDIEKIKHILFGHEKKALDAISRRIELPESRSEDIADVLSDAVRRAQARDPQFVKSLRPSVETCLKDSVNQDPQSFADALYPAMGPAIRRSIAEYFKAAVQSLNSAIENSLSIRTRFAAKRAGLSIGEYVLRQGLIYRAEQVFLIKPGDGLLMAHEALEGVAHQDEDAVSAMFTAIQSFVQDAFSSEGGARSQGLATAEVGEFTVWAVHGPYAMLACVWRGNPRASLRAELDQILEDIHLRFGQQLRHYQGDETIAGLPEQLHRCFELQKTTQVLPAHKKRRPWPIIILSALLLTWLGVSLFQGWQHRQMHDALSQAFADEPGWHITDIHRQKGQFYLRGLKDPLATPADAVLASLVLKRRPVLDITPYQSLAPALLVQHWRQQGDLPKDIQVQTESQTIRLVGTVTVAQYARLKSLSSELPSGLLLDTAGVSLDDGGLAKQLAKRWALPDTVSLTVQGTDIQLVGYAPLAWFEQYPAHVAGLDAGFTVNDDALVVLELKTLRALTAGLEGDAIFFADGVGLVAGAGDSLARWAEQVLQVRRLSAQLGWQSVFILRGHTDGTGTEEKNRPLRIGRAERIQNGLIEKGVSRDWLRTEYATQSHVGEKALSERKTTMSINFFDAQQREVSIHDRYQP